MIRARSFHYPFGQGEEQGNDVAGSQNTLMRRFAALAVLALLMLSAIAVPSTAAAPRNPNGVAVIIGNADYKNEQVPDVTYAGRDAAAFQRYVIDVLGYDPENIINLRDASQAQMFGAFGNQRNPRGRLWSLLDPEGGSDVVVFYSGHGVPGLNDRRGYLLPVDAAPDTADINGYPIDLLYENLGKLKEAKSVRVFLDACFSGGSPRGMLIRSASPVFVKAVLPKAARDWHGPHTNRVRLWTRSPATPTLDRHWSRIPP